MPQQELLERFEQYLLEGGFRIGDRLPPEPELARRFGVARSTVREVIVHLTFAGILSRRPRRGTVIAMPSPEDIGRGLAFQLRWLDGGFEELKNTRLMLETGAAPAIARCAAPGQIARLEEIHRAMTAVADNPEKADRFDCEFHMAMMEITGSRTATVFAQIVQLLFRREYRRRQLERYDAGESVAAHARILEAIRRHDGAELRKLLEEHLSGL